MAIADIGLQIRDSNVPQLLLEFGAGIDSTFGVDASGFLTIAPSGETTKITGALTTFQLESTAVGENAELVFLTGGIGQGRIVNPAGDVAIVAGAVSAVFSGTGFTLGTGTVRFQQGGDPSRFRITDPIETSPRLEIVPGAPAGIPGILIYNDPDTANAERIQIQTSTDWAHFRVVTTGVPAVPITQWRFGDVPMVLDFAIGIADGDLANPGLFVVSDPDTGLTALSGNQLSVVVAGGEVIKFSNLSIQAQKQIQSINGTVTAPSYSFALASTSGMWWDSANSRVVTSVAGAGIHYASAGGFVSIVPIFAPDGSATNPSYSFTNFPDRGMFQTAGNLQFAMDGLPRMLISNTGRTTLVNTLDNEVLRLKRDAAGGEPGLTFHDDVGQIGQIDILPTLMRIGVPTGRSIALRINNSDRLTINDAEIVNGAAMRYTHLRPVSGDIILRRDDGLSGGNGVAFAGVAGSVVVRVIPSGANEAAITMHNDGIAADRAEFKLKVSGATAFIEGFSVGAPLVPIAAMNFNLLGNTLLQLNSNQVKVIQSGSAAAPSLKIGSEASGWYPGTGNIHVAVAGAHRWSFGAVHTSVASINPSSGGTFNLGTSVLTWGTIFADNLVLTNPLPSGPVIGAMLRYDLTAIGSVAAFDDGELIVSFPGAASGDGFIAGQSGGIPYAFITMASFQAVDQVQIQVRNTGSGNLSASGMFVDVIQIRP